MMEKKGIKLISAIVILALLGGAYYFGMRENSGDEETSDTAEENEISLTERDISLFKECEIENGLDIILKGDGSFSVKGYEDYIYNQSNIGAVVQSAVNFKAAERLEKTSELSEYGLDKSADAARVYYTDGSSDEIRLGKLTPDGNYCYAMINDDESVYMIDSLTARRFDYGLDDVIDKSMTKISMYEAYYIYIDQKDKPLIEIEYDEKEASEGNGKELSSLGFQTLTMISPYKGAVVYPYNLEGTILAGLPKLAIERLIDIAPEDLAQYGFDEPSLEVRLRDANGKLRLVIGNDIDKENVYCMVDDRPHIFSVKKSAVEPFMNSNPISYIQKFFALKTRVETKEVEITKGDEKYKVTFSEFPEIKDGEEESMVDSRTPYINGKEIEKEKFDDFFEAVIGITFDSIDNDLSAEGDAEVTMKYLMTDGSSTEVNYYRYGENANFYIGENNGNAVYLVNRQTVDNVLKMARELGSN